MRCIRIVIGLSGLLLASTAALAGDAADKPSEYPAIGTLRAEMLQSLPYNCECEFFRRPINGATTVFATRRERVVAFVVVDGRLVTLRRDGKPHNAGCGKNVGYHERWVGGATSVVLHYHPTGSGEESCWFEGKMNIAVGKSTTSTDVSGACGC
jgi:hypothetical protein